jgi:two-component system response regulator AtoC
MDQIKINLKIFSDSKDTASVTSAARQAELRNVNLSVSYPKNFEVKENDIIILQIDRLESKLLARLNKLKSEIKNKILFVFNEANALVLSTVVKMGFTDVFVFPYEIFKFTSYLSEIIQNNTYRTDASIQPGSFTGSYGIHSIIGNSEEFRSIIELAKKVSEKSRANVLILGETGTGKGLLARAIHNHSKKSDEPFVDIVCTAIPESLLESELFGYEAGAFTNAKSRKYGLFELADKGTLFLDEIGDLSLNIQSKLLRAIEKKVIRRLGGTVDIPFNSRIISATNKDLELMVEKKLFRRDLYHRLNVVSIQIPALRERGDDILLLANHFIQEYSKQFNKEIKKMDNDLKQFMLGYTWPGNIREMRNAIERAVLLSDDNVLHLKDFSNIINNVPANFPLGQREEKLPPQIIRIDLNYGTTNLKKLTKHYAREVLNKTKGNKSQAAKLLGISRPKLDSLLKN